MGRILNVRLTMWLLRWIALAAGLCSQAGVARPDSLNYTLSGSVSMTFTLPVNPAIQSANADSGFGFTVVPSNLVINGVASSDFLAFYSTADGGGFGAFSSSTQFDVLTTGVQLYSGSESSPTMLGPSLLTLPAILLDYNTIAVYSLTASVVTGNFEGHGAANRNGAVIAEPSLRGCLAVTVLCCMIYATLRRLRAVKVA